MTDPNCTGGAPITVDASTGKVIPSPPRAERINLHDINAVRREMSKVYRDMRLRKIDSQDGARMVYVLDRIAKLHELADLERRLQELERITDGNG